MQKISAEPHPPLRVVRPDLPPSARGDHRPRARKGPGGALPRTAPRWRRRCATARATSTRRCVDGPLRIAAQSRAGCRLDRHRQGARAQRGLDRPGRRHRPVRAGGRHGRLQRRRGRERHRGQDDHRTSCARPTWRRNCDGSDKATGLHRPSIILRDAIARANKIIHQTSKSQTQCEGMGTTVVAAPVPRQPAHARPRRRLADVPAAQGQLSSS